jgi:hypothetical protein
VISPGAATAKACLLREKLVSVLVSGGFSFWFAPVRMDAWDVSHGAHINTGDFVSVVGGALCCALT